MFSSCSFLIKVSVSIFSAFLPLEYSVFTLTLLSASKYSFFYPTALFSSSSYFTLIERDSGLMQTIENYGLFLERIFFYFRHDFFRRILPPKNVFFYLSHFGGCEDDLYISTQQIDGWADTLKTFNKTPH